MAQASKAVYRRRRLAALVVLVALILLVWWAVSAIRGAFFSSASNGTGEASASASNLDVSECAPRDMTVTAAADKAQYGVADHPVLTMQVANVSEQDGAANVGTSQQSFVVGSGDASLWYSKPCVTNAADLTQVIRAGQTLSGTVTWDGTTNTATTCEKSTAASGRPGTYWVTATLGDVMSEKTVFTIQ